MKVHLRLSQQARANTTERLIYLGYTQPGAFRKLHGLGPYLSRVSQYPLKDTRPANIRALDLFRLRRGLMPVFHTEARRYVVLTCLDDDTITSLLAQAKVLNVTNHTRPNLIDNQNGTLSALTEALGLGWLTSTAADTTLRAPIAAVHATRPGRVNLMERITSNA